MLARSSGVGIEVLHEQERPVGRGHGLGDVGVAGRHGVAAGLAGRAPPLPRQPDELGAQQPEGAEGSGHVVGAADAEGEAARRRGDRRRRPVLHLDAHGARAYGLHRSASPRPLS